MIETLTKLYKRLQAAQNSPYRFAPRGSLIRLIEAQKLSIQTRGLLIEEQRRTIRITEENNEALRGLCRSEVPGFAEKEQEVADFIRVLSEGGAI